jgi:hypothetical protein
MTGLLFSGDLALGLYLTASGGAENAEEARMTASQSRIQGAPDLIGYTAVSVPSLMLLVRLL